MGSKGSQTTTTQQAQTYQPNPAVVKAGTQALGMAQTAAGQPFQMPVAPVAGFTPLQEQYFQGVQNMQGMAQPYFGAGANYLTGSAAPITGGDVANYYNPMAANVTAQMQNIFGQQMREATGKATQLAGGVGADRIGVAQANLANQQGLAAGQTYAGLYQQALQAAEQQKQMMAGAGYGLAQMGPAAQAAQLQGLGALGMAGGQQQQLTQAQMNALYQNQLAQIAYPFQTAQYLAGITGGIGPSMGYQQYGTGRTTLPSPTTGAQIAGIGLGGVGLLGASGAFGNQGWLSGITNPYGVDTAGWNAPLSAGDFVAQRGGRIPNPFAEGGEVIPFPMQGSPDDFLIWDENVDKAVQKHLARRNPEAQATRATLSRALGTTGNVIPFHPFDPRSPSSGGDLTPVYQSGGAADLQDEESYIPGIEAADDKYLSPIPHIKMSGANAPKPMDLTPKVSESTTSGGGGSALGTALSIGMKLLPLALAARGGAVNPFDVGQPFQDAGAVPYDDSVPDQPVQLAFNRDASIASDAGDILGRAAAVTKQQESGGDYGNITTTRNRQGAPQSAIGAYGVMDFNVGPWTKEVLGREMTPDQFRNDPAAQDAVYRAKMGQYISKYGPEGAGRAWLGGPGGVTNPFATDPLGTSVGSYGQRFAQGLGQTTASPMAPNADMTAGQYMLPAADRPYPDALQRDWGQNMTRSPWMALVAAGAQMAQTRGPIGSVIGAGMGAGAKELEGQRKELRSEQEINMKAQQLYQQAAEHLDQYKRIPAGTQAELVMKQQLINKQLQQLELEGLRPFKIGEDTSTGVDIYGIRNPKDGSIIPIDPTTGRPRTEIGAGVAQPAEPAKESQSQAPAPLGVDEFRPNLNPVKSTAPTMVKGPFATAEAGNIRNIDQQMNKERNALDVQHDQINRLKMDYAIVMKDSDKDGFFTRLMTMPGADPESRVSAMRTANLAATSAGKPPVFSPEKVAAMEEAIKIQKTMGMSFAATISPRDAMQMQLASISAQPGFTQSPQGMQRLIGLYDGLVNHNEARHDFWGRWKQTNPRTSSGWEEDFRTKNPVDMYTTRALIENMPNQRAKAALPQAIEYLRQHRNDPAEIAKFDKIFNNTSSYFLNGKLDPYASLR